MGGIIPLSEQGNRSSQLPGINRVKEEIFKTELIGLCVANILVCVPYVRVNYLTFVECLNLHLYRCQVKYVVCSVHMHLVFQYST